MWRARRLKGSTAKSHLFCIENEYGIFKYPVDDVLRFHGFNNAETACLLLGKEKLEHHARSIYEVVEPYAIQSNRRIRLCLDMTHESELLDALRNQAAVAGDTLHQVIKQALRQRFMR